MSLCARCAAQIDRPGHFPPHAGLVRHGQWLTASGQNVFAYRCEGCGHAILLTAAHEDAPDRWVLADDVSGTA
jgi:DNA-directed RNA polymerase subunit RPC12/RpoP